MAKNITLMNNDGTEVLYPKGQLVGIDTSRLLAHTSSSYTATEDCIAFFRAANNYYTKINNVDIVKSANDDDVISVFMKKGDTITNSFNFNVRVFGVKH